MPFNPSPDADWVPLAFHPSRLSTTLNEHFGYGNTVFLDELEYCKYWQVVLNVNTGYFHNNATFWITFRLWCYTDRNTMR